MEKFIIVIFLCALGALINAIHETHRDKEDFSWSYEIGFVVGIIIANI